MEALTQTELQIRPAGKPPGKIPLAERGARRDFVRMDQTWMKPGRSNHGGAGKGLDQKNPNDSQTRQSHVPEMIHPPRRQPTHRSSVAVPGIPGHLFSRTTTTP